MAPGERVADRCRNGCRNPANHSVGRRDQHQVAPAPHREALARRNCDGSICPELIKATIEMLNAQGWRVVKQIYRLGDG
jgi:hypothetical protein